MKKHRKLAILTVAAMAVMSVSAASAAPVNDAHQISQTKSASTTKMQSNSITPNSTYVFTTTWEKSYQNLYGMTVATQDATTQWTGNYSSNLSKGSLWQDNWTAVAYSYDTEANNWNYFYSNVGESKESVHFSSGIPTPWGNVGGSSFTSTIVTDVYPDGSSS